MSQCYNFQLVCLNVTVILDAFQTELKCCAINPEGAFKFVIGYVVLCLLNSAQLEQFLDFLCLLKLSEDADSNAVSAVDVTIQPRIP